jgi:hypothetical protein
VPSRLKNIGKERYFYVKVDQKWEQFWGGLPFMEQNVPLALRA